jgi:hypothetical protein
VSQWFNKLPGFTRTPAGHERTILRLLPRVLVLGTAALALPSLAVRALLVLWPEVASASAVTTIDIYGISLAIFHWAILCVVAIAAFIVMVMKGPAYVADPYPLNDADTPDDPTNGPRP